MKVNGNYQSAYGYGVSKTSDKADKAKVPTDTKDAKKVSNYDEFIPTQKADPQPKKLVLPVPGLNTTIHGDKYIAGEQSIDGYKQEFKDSFRELLDYNIQNGFSNGTDKADITAILQNVYSDFKVHAIGEAMRANSAEQTEKYGVGPYSCYYNADNYYFSEEMCTALDEMFNELSAEYDLGDIPKGKVYHEDFNSYWNFLNKDAVDFDPDKAGPPPKGFKMYFQVRVNTENEEKEEFHLEAHDDKNGIAITTAIPKGASLLRPNSKLLLSQLKQMNINIPGRTAYDLSDLVKDYPGKNISEKTHNFLLENMYNPSARNLSVSCGDWQLDSEIPFMTSYINKYEGSKLVDPNNEASNYLSSFVFKSGRPDIVVDLYK